MSTCCSSLHCFRRRSRQTYVSAYIIIIYHAHRALKSRPGPVDPKALPGSPGVPGRKISGMSEKSRWSPLGSKTCGRLAILLMVINAPVLHVNERNLFVFVLLMFIHIHVCWSKAPFERHGRTACLYLLKINRNLIENP